MIRAEVHSDDYHYALKIDAAPFFLSANAQDIMNLARCDWGGDYPADEVARFVSELPGYEEVSELLGHCQRQHARGKSVGFECHVHPADVLPWLQVNRPELLPELVREAGTQEVFDEQFQSFATAPHWEQDSSWTGDYILPAAPEPQP